MTAQQIDAVLTAAEAALGAGDTPDMGAFWRAVAAVKRSPDAVAEFADRIGAIDRAVFARWATITVPMWVGTPLVSAAALAGLALLGAMFAVDEPWNGVAFVAGTFVLLAAVHTLAHLVVGRLLGIRFTAWFWSAHPPLPPGVKTDYATYLRTPARARAWMHAAGAIATKVVPFIALPIGALAGVPWWSIGAITAIALGQLVIDAVWSVKASDWKKFRREMAVAHSTEG